MTTKECLEKYGQPDKFIDSFGIMNYVFPREMGVEDALKVACGLSKEPQYRMCVCFARQNGDEYIFRDKNSDKIVVSKLHLLKEQYGQ